LEASRFISLIILGADATIKSNLGLTPQQESKLNIIFEVFQIFEVFIMKLGGQE
jgi:hypothetical protein